MTIAPPRPGVILFCATICRAAAWPHCVNRTNVSRYLQLASKWAVLFASHTIHEACIRKHGRFISPSCERGADTRKTPFRLTLMTSSKSASVISRNSALFTIPAQSPRSLNDMNHCSPKPFHHANMQYTHVPAAYAPDDDGGKCIPALATRMSRDPYCWTAYATKRSTSVFLVTSHLAAHATMPSCSSCVTALHIHKGVRERPGSQTTADAAPKEHRARLT